MKLKLDENLGQRIKDRLIQAGHDVSTVVDQGLTSATDEVVIDICASEGRALVTLDLDFANPLRFNPAAYAGVAVLRPAAPTTFETLGEAVETLIGGLARETIAERLWIVQRNRIRVYEPLSE